MNAAQRVHLDRRIAEEGMIERPDRIVIDDPGYSGPPPTAAQIAAITEAGRAAGRMVGYSIAATLGAPVAQVSDYWLEKVAR